MSAYDEIIRAIREQERLLAPTPTGCENLYEAKTCPPLPYTFATLVVLLVFV